MSSTGNQFEKDKSKDREYKLTFENKQMAILLGANELLPDIIYDNKLVDFNSWFKQADSNGNTEQCEKWDEAFQKQLLKNCKKPLRSETPDSLVFSIEDAKNENELLESLSKSIQTPIETTKKINAETILSHLEELQKENNNTIPHAEILHHLIEQIETFDFYNAIPTDQLNGKKGIEKKHYLVLSIENVLTYAERSCWGLCKNNDFIYLYNGAFWSEIDAETFKKFLGEASEKMSVPIFDARVYYFRDSLFKQFLTTAYLPTPKSDKNKVLINLLNGTFEINQKKTELKSFDSSDFITYQLPFEYNAIAEAPIFEAYLNKVLPDKERQNVLAEFIGSVFIKNGSNALKEEKALILYGTGANGKSLFFEIINALLGNDNISSYSLQNLTNDNGYYRAKIANKLVNYASEINGKLETAIFKQLVSGEPVDARLPYGKPFNMTQYAKLIFNCNELPKDVEHTNAYFRRFLIIPFDVTIPEHEQDKNLHTKIIENELSGVFNWVLEGLNRLLEQKRFSDCDATKKALEQYKAESNSVQMFITENDYQSDVTNYELITEIYTMYKTFCFEDGMTPFKKSNFIKQLRSLNFIVDRVAQNKLAVFIIIVRQ